VGAVAFGSVEHGGMPAWARKAESAQ
jgi:hypothetical protein